MVLRIKRILNKKKKKNLKETTELQFLKQMIRLLNSGYAIIDALKFLEWDRRFLDPALIISELLKQGEPIDVAFKAARFSDFVCEQLYFIRINNALLETFTKTHELFKQRLEHKKNLQKSLRYPMILLGVFAVLLFFIRNYVLPSFMDMFHGGASSNSSIHLSLLFINIFLAMFFITVVSSVFFIILWKLFAKQMPIERKINLYRKIPFFRTYLTWYVSFQLAHHLGILLKSGLPLNDILKYLEKQKSSEIMQFYASSMKRHLERGESLPLLLSTFNFLDKPFVFIFENYLDSIMLGKDLVAYSQILTERIEQTMVKIISYIQPVFFITIACFIIFIYISVLYPMFELIQTV